MYRRAQGQAMLRRAALILTAVIVISALAAKLRRGDTLSISPLAKPTATPVSMGFDETVVSRDVTFEKLTWYALQTGIFSSQEAADAKALAYADRGAPGYVSPDGDKFRVLIACYDTETDAASVRDRLASAQEVDVYLHRWELPEMSLRLTGMAGQLDVAEAGMQLLRQSAALLRDAAIAMDRGESDPDDALRLLSGLNDQYVLWRRTARQRFVQPYPAMIGALLSLADGWDTQYTDLKGASGSVTALSASLKIHAMEQYAHLAQLYALIQAP
ncbi:MAG: SPOR domain-containing protein [Clostridia bacterium]|nr:SPOR domain-containing protein [Clostridia bacterium]